MTAMRSIIRAAIKNQDDPHNILMLLDENNLTYISKLAETGNTFYFWEDVNEMGWNNSVAMKPENILSIKGQALPEYIDFDIVLCSNRGFFQFCKNIADFWHLPLILFESQVPDEEYKQADPQGWLEVRQCEGDINVFASDESRNNWGPIGHFHAVGYTITEDSDSFCDSWNNVFLEACSLVYTRM